MKKENKKISSLRTKNQELRTKVSKLKKLLREVCTVLRAHETINDRVQDLASTTLASSDYFKREMEG